MDLTILQSRFDFLQNYLEEKSSSLLEEDNDHDYDNISSKCLSCLEQAENLLREEIDTSALPLGEKHLADLKVLNLLILNNLVSNFQFLISINLLNFDLNRFGVYCFLWYDKL